MFGVLIPVHETLNTEPAGMAVVTFMFNRLPKIALVELDDEVAAV